MADPGVYVNNRSACSKAASGWSPAATPDPCVSPGPVVVPYPNTSKATDLKKGTTTVFIKNKMVSQKNKSYFSTSMGDEPATPGLSKGVATGVIKGKSYFTSWSQNVKFEGLAVNRHQDLMTHNHGSFPGNTPTFPYIDKAATGGNPCENEEKKMKEECEDKGVWPDGACSGLEKVYTGDELAKEDRFADQKAAARKQDSIARSNDCIKARKCNLVPYDSDKQRGAVYNTPNASSGKERGCCTGQTGHHLVSDASVKDSGCSTYNPNHAPTVCVEGMSWHTGSHKSIHENLAELNQVEALNNQALETPLNRSIDLSTKSFMRTFKDSNCSEDCIKTQLTNYYKQCCGDDLTAKKTKLVDYKGDPLKEVPSRKRARSEGNP